MNTKRLLLSSIGLLAAGTCVTRAALTDNLVAYYNFDASGTAGIANQISGGSSYDGAYINANANGSGAGFAGNAAFAGVSATSTTNRSTLLVGDALNVVKNVSGSTAGTGQFSVAGLTSMTLGANYTISSWFYLAPDADNATSTADIGRNYVFEGSANYNVSFGTNAATGSTYTSYVNQVAASATTVLSTGAWHNVVQTFTVGATNTALSVYLDGVLTATGSGANSSFTGINFGSARGGIRIFDGMIDEVGVWNRTLSASDSTDVYNAGLAGIALTAVPEPSTYGLLGAGALAATAVIRRRRKIA